MKAAKGAREKGKKSGNAFSASGQAMTGKPIISAHGLAKSYGKITAVAGVDLSIMGGEIFGLLGPNGAGKTTTLMMLATLVKPTSGTAEVNGSDVTREPGKVRKSIGMVFQDPSSDDILTGYENLKLHGMLYGMGASLREERAAEVLNLTELTERKDDLVKKYSGGMRRRLELGRGLMHRPRVLFLDEPTLGLDPQSRDNIWGYIERLARKENITIIITTHYMEEADRLCGRVAIIDKGKIVALGTPRELKETIGGDVVVLKTAKDSLQRMKKLPFVRAASYKDGHMMLSVKSAGSNLPRLLREAGKVENVEMRPPTLEDVFMHFTGKKIREGPAEGGVFDRMMHRRSG
jgi:ABC-2 type transport system ATP-binding protein